MRWPRREEETQRLARQANEEIKREAAEQQAQNHQDRANIARVLRRLTIYKKAEEKHRNAEKKRWFTGKNVREWLIAIGAVGAFFFAARQWVVMRGQLAEMQTEQRPWIQIKEARFNDLALPANSDTINIQFSLTLKNIGKTPALGIYASFQGYVETLKTFGAADALEEKKCAESKNFPARKGFESLMPQEEQNPYSLTATVSMKQAIADAVADWQAHTTFWTPEYAAKMAPLRDKLDHEVTFVVSGCIDYFLSPDMRDRGQTYFRYIVARGLPGLGYDGEIPLPINGSLNPPEVGMTKAMEGNYAQ